MRATAQPRDGAGNLFARPQIEVSRQTDGSIVLGSRQTLEAAPPSIGHWLAHWGTNDPQRPFLAERDAAGGLHQLNYGEALAATLAIGQSLVDRRLSANLPILILAENGIDHALMMLGALHAGCPVAPVSTAYARLSTDFGKLRHIATKIAPRLVYVDDVDRYAKALAALDLGAAEIVASRGMLPGRATTAFASLLVTQPGHGIADAFACVTHDTLAKVLFTSGSTGAPKGVLNTQRMLTINQDSLAAVWPFVTRIPPRLVDWLPWNHTYGGNHNFNLVLRNGGFLFIDEGRPLPGMIERTVENLRAVAPTIYFGVPRGFAVLLDHLERDEALQANFFDQLQLIMYAGASLPQSLWERIDGLARRVRGAPIAMTAGWGLTETAPVVTTAHYAVDRPGNIGVPVPGTTVKLVPSGDKLEIRCKGPGVTPGYYKEPALTAAAFDADGWLLTGDAVRFADPDDPSQGLMFDGRTAENFKLSSGTWVSVGPLRTALITALAPLAEDCVITGHDGDEIGVLVFPSMAALRRLLPAGGDTAGIADVIAAPAVIEAMRQRLAAYNGTAGGSSVADRPGADSDGTALDRRWRDDRQGLPQPAGCAGAAGRPCCQPACDASRRGCDRAWAPVIFQLSRKAALATGRTILISVAMEDAPRVVLPPAHLGDAKRALDAVPVDIADHVLEVDAERGVQANVGDHVFQPEIRGNDVLRRPPEARADLGDAALIAAEPTEDEYVRFRRPERNERL